MKQTDKINLVLKQYMGNSLKKVLVSLLHPFRNQFILFNVPNRAKNNRVNLDYWSESDNLGDTLAPIIVNHMLDKKEIKADKVVNGRKLLLKPKVDFLKYDDWYYSTKRYEYPVAETIEEGMKMMPLNLPKNLDELRKGQEMAFPYDLYEV